MTLFHLCETLIFEIFILKCRLSLESSVVKDNISVLSWNLAGLHEDDLEVRTLSVCEVINTKQPDVCLLQEVVDDSLGILMSKYMDK